ncbi:MAG: ABC transporter ATP-binding protein, partial [Duncaniella sp.]|nr:ABC transporter ATP-binding protein [Duncaniella sp.]
AMIKLLLEPVNLLILDEPTNHLDMKTKDILKQAIKDFNGTVIVVSHDREFLDGLVEKVYEFGGGQVRECLGGIYEFLEKKKLDSLAELERNTIRPVQAADKTKAKEQPASEPAAQESPRRRSYAEQKEYEKMLRKLRKAVEEAENEVSRIEKEIADAEALMNDANPPADIYERHGRLNKQLENAISVWELAGIELEEYQNRK